MADRDTTSTGGPNQNPTWTNPAATNPTTKGSPEPMARTGTTETGRTGTQDTMSDIKANLGRVTSEAADSAIDSGRQAASSAGGRIRSLLEGQTDRAADQLGGVASALHKAAEQLDAENNGTAAQYAVQAADRVERVADMLRHSTLDDIVGEVEGFARRQPEVFIGAAFAVGFLAARFIKSSGERRMASQTSGTASLQGRTATNRPRRTSDYQTSGYSGMEGSGRGMAGGIADSALRTPQRMTETSGTNADMAKSTLGMTSGSNAGTTTPSGTATGTTAGAKPTVGAPLSRAPSPAAGQGTPSTTSTSTTGTNTTTTTKPQEQRP